MKIRRNSTCPCGSGKKYKVCCGKNETTNSNKIKNIHTKSSKEKYVQEKSKMAEQMFIQLHKKDYVFKIEEVFNDNAFKSFKNLKRKHTLPYLILLEGFLQNQELNTDMESLVWSSEYLDILNNHHDEIMKEVPMEFEEIHELIQELQL